MNQKTYTYDEVIEFLEKELRANLSAAKGYAYLANKSKLNLLKSYWYYSRCKFWSAMAKGVVFTIYRFKKNSK